MIVATGVGNVVEAQAEINEKIVHALFLEPVGVHDVVISRSAENLSLLGRNSFQEPGRIARVNRAGRNNRVLGDYSTSGNDATCANDGPVHNDGSHANQNVIFQGTAMNHRVVRNGYIVTNYGFVPLVGAVNDCAVLNVGSVANGDAIDITPDNSVEPDCAVASHSYFANNSCVVSVPAVFAELGMISPNRFNECHTTKIG